MMGSGIGSISLDRLVHAAAELLRATVPGGFQIAATPVPLSEVAEAWPKDRSTGRTVFVVDRKA
jgi:hypothetical protein